MKIKVSPFVAERIRRTREDFRVDTFRAGGKGGQNQNKVETGVRITDKITGISAEAREERSQLQNKKRAFRRLALRIVSHYKTEELIEKLNRLKEKLPTIRTYKEGRVIDHRTGKSYDLDPIMNGDLAQMIRDLHEHQGCHENHHSQ